jgi:hypothetical protein
MLSFIINLLGMSTSWAKLKSQRDQFIYGNILRLNPTLHARAKLAFSHVWEYTNAV